jgi:kinesin family protein C2/C3
MILAERPEKPAKKEIVLNETISIPSKPQSRNPSKPASRNASVGHSRKNSSESNDCSQSVKVVIRVRPPLKAETWDKANFHIHSNKISIKENKQRAEVKTFDFENIVVPDQDEDQMFKQVNDGVLAALNGKNACILAYGQTGSGKTYTMNSMIEKSIATLANIKDVDVSVQCIEVYNEQVHNLNPCQNAGQSLSESPCKNKDNADIFEVKLGRVWADKALETIKESMMRRTTKFTDCNERSSRSHAIYTIIFYGDFTWKIQFVDLAGSERVGKSNVKGETLKEALNINKSLSALQDVISALENKQKHVPYRNSQLTKLLQSTLGGSQSVVTMIINCSPSNESLSETVCTLNLASRVKAVDLGFFIRKNLKTQEVERTLNLLEKERAEKSSLMRTLDKLHRDLESYQIAVKDRDNKIKVLNEKMKSRGKNFFDPINREGKKSCEVRGKAKVDKTKTKSRNLIHLNIKEIGRVVSHSPTLTFLNSPNMNEKPTRIPAPSFLNLRIGSSI